MLERTGDGITRIEVINLVRDESILIHLPKYDNQKYILVSLRSL